ncbi:PAS domain S-box protein [Desulfamplus magnetovallimortis]|uniref:PAS domain S-box protein n=1 Tax=Desulfamplus magnetovallimortis TaxID=1246637 RepID=A0A1W1H691_9BACT|nr:sigma 54-interacting transcriptional regulator [Desulfamplus magnetovallimortis]SLM27954.1 PAS domain S-box protein [Desulfamplus magnetovallimortis]
MDIGKYWRTIIESVRDGVMIVNAKGNIIAANSTAQLMTGYTEDDLIGRSCRTLNCTGCTIIGKGEGKLWCGLFSRGMIRDRKCRITNRYNRSIHIMKSANVLYDDDGNIVGAVETLKDISDNVNYKNELISLKKTYQLDDGFHGIVGKSPVMQSLFEVIENVAASDTPVMILGESGTGKELVARAVHETGSRLGKPFIKVNCAALNENLLESELFGHIRGAYTGADKSRTGRFEAAHGGSIFLDEIGDIPMSIQVKLLRVLEEKKIERVGDNLSIDVDVRIITATNRNLDVLMKEGRFREDLFFRINVFPLNCPPLSVREGDIPLIIQHFVEVNTRKNGKNILGLSPDAMRQMVRYSWPGNVRELRNAVEYAFVLCHGSMITPEHLPDKVLQGMSKRNHCVGIVEGSIREDSNNQEKTSSAENAVVQKGKVQELEDALWAEKGNQSRAAERLGVSRVTVWKRMKKFGIDPKRFCP